MWTSSVDNQHIMKHNRLTILAINPGTRYIGIAVLKGPILFDWSVKVMSGKLSKEKLEKTARIVSHLIAEYKPDVLVLKKLHSSRSSVYLDQIIREIEECALTSDIMLKEYSIQELETFFAPETRINKKTMAELVCQRHPVLRYDLHKEQDNFNPYYIRMFEAAALGTMAQVTASKIN